MRKLLPSILSLLMMAAVASQVQSQQAKGSEAFASFWMQFKAAVAKNDKEAVASMIRFPFYSGEELTKGQFIKKYNAIFDRKTQRCFAKAKPANDYLESIKAARKYPKSGVPLQPNNGSYSMFCGDEIYVFEIVNGQYKLTEIGAND